MTDSEVRNLKQGLELAALISELEGDVTPKDEHDFYQPFRDIRVKSEAEDAPLDPTALAEEIAFAMHAHDRQGPSEWGIQFGPMMSGPSANGKGWEYPARADVTDAMLSYWRSRALACPHPVMRGRYADLLWELPLAIDRKRDAQMGRLAVDAYVEAASTGRYDEPVVMIAKLQRALTIALSLRDATRVEQARDAILRLDDGSAHDAHPGLWGFAWDILVEPGTRGVNVSDVAVERLRTDLEARFARVSAEPATAYHPFIAEQTALRLASWYRRQRQIDDAHRVLRIYAECVKRMVGVSPGMVAAHSLEGLHALLQDFGLAKEALALDPMLRQAGQDAASEMKTINVTTTVESAKVEAFHAALLEGTPEQALARLTAHFVPSRTNLESQLRDLAQKSPLMFLMSRAIQDHAGRTVARIGSIEDDFGGQLASHLGQNLGLAVPWLREAVERGIASGAFTAERTVTALFMSPLFTDDRRALLELGVKAWIEGRAVEAIHILVPQIEQALRNLAVLLGAPIHVPREGGGWHVRQLGGLLRDTAVRGALSEDVAWYLEVLLTDQRGWNLRNDVGHGLAPAGLLTMPVADRVVHALLVLGSIRERPSSGDA